MYDLSISGMKIINNEQQNMIHDIEFDVNIFNLNEKITVSQISFS